jgi:Tol biopolymer transport system component
VYDLERGTLTKVSFGGDDYNPTWSPDGKMLAYYSTKSGNAQVYVKHGIVQGDEDMVTSGPGFKELWDWTPDGTELILEIQNKDTGWDIYAAPVQGDHKPRPLVVAPFNQTQARISADGKWLAYVSDESGQPEVFVQSMNDSSTRAQVSSEGGNYPRWARSGDELFFLSKNKVMSVKFAPGNLLGPGKPTLLFESKDEWTGYGLAPDGRFVVALDTGDNSAGNQINVVLHWLDEVKEAQRR